MTAGWVTMGRVTTGGWQWDGQQRVGNNGVGKRQRGVVGVTTGVGGGGLTMGWVTTGG